MWATIASLAGCRQIDTLGLPASRRPDLSKTLREESPPQVFHSNALTRERKADLQITLARTAEQRGEADNAVRGYHEALENDDSRAEAYHRLAVLHDRKGDFQKAESLYLEALTRAPNNPEIHCDLGYSYYVRQRWHDGERSLRAALDLAPNLARAHNNLGMLLARTGRVDEALYEFSRAGLSESRARVNLALVLTLDGHLEAAREELQLASLADAEAATRDRVARISQAISCAQTPPGDRRRLALSQRR
jgi:Flp pilus assembly protein TadD